MNWTNDKPTEPGYYWFRAKPGAPPTVLCIARLLSGQLMQQTDPERPIFRDLPAGERCGPLEPPK